MVEAAAAESETTAFVFAFSVNDVAFVLATLMSEPVAVAVKDAVLSRPTVWTKVFPLRAIDVVAVTPDVRSIAPAEELSTRLFVLIVPVGNDIVAPELIVTEFVPFNVFCTDTACVAAPLAVKVMLLAWIVPTFDVCSRLAVVAVTLRFPPTVPAFKVTVDAAAAESDTTALVLAFNVNDVAFVFATLISEPVAVAVKEAVFSKPTVCTKVLPLKLIDEVAVTADVRSIAPADEFSTRLLVLIVPVGKEMVAPELIVTEFVPFNVSLTETA